MKNQAVKAGHSAANKCRGAMHHPGRPPCPEREETSRSTVHGLRRTLPLFILTVLLTLSCAGRPPAMDRKRPAPALVPVIDMESYPDFSDDMLLDGLLHAIDRSIDYLERLPPGRLFSFGTDTYTAAHMILSLTRFSEFVAKQPSPAEINRFIRRHYLLYRSIGSDGSGRVLFTGYYEPVLAGSRHRTRVYRYPVHSRPRDHTVVDLSRFGIDTPRKTLIGRYTGQRVIPYYERKEIVNDPDINRTAPPIAWVKDRVGLFFLQIQGSGKIVFEDGGSINIHYHCTNGRPYRSIGKLLIDEGKIPREEMSMQAIRAYLDAHPGEIDDILNYNPSYVFFKTEPDGPLGFLNVRLTPGRSIAVDYRQLPVSALGFAAFQKPLIDTAGRVTGWVPATRFVLAQDTGGAIRGPGRIDIFWGDGPYAETAAGHMKQQGSIYFLVLKPGAQAGDGNFTQSQQGPAGQKKNSTPHSRTERAQVPVLP